MNDNGIVVNTLIDRIIRLGILEEQIIKYIRNEYSLLVTYNRDRWWIYGKTKNNSHMPLTFDDIADLLEWCKANREVEVDNE